MYKKILSIAIGLVMLFPYGAVATEYGLVVDEEIIAGETEEAFELENSTDYIEIESDIEFETDTEIYIEDYTEIEESTESIVQDSKTDIANIEFDEGLIKRFIVKYATIPETTIETELFNSDIITSKSVVQTMDVLEDVATSENNIFEVIEFEEGIDESSFLEYAEQLFDMDQIEYIQPDYEITLSSFSDEEISNGVAFQMESNGMSSISILNSGESCVVAVIDSGADITHPLFENRVYENTAEYESNEDDDLNGYVNDVSGWNFVDNNNEIYNEENSYDYYHGTHVAGIIAQSSGNAKILNLKAFKNGKAYTSDVIEAINYAEMMGAKVINCSFGSTEENLALSETIENSSALFVCAAGNGRKNLDDAAIYPAAYDFDNVISVASMNKNDGISYFSNYGENSVDIAAYGEEIYSSYPEGKYGKFSGTSQAAAFVSGVACELLSQEELTASEARERILTCSDKYSSLYGKVNNLRKLNKQNILTGNCVNDITEVYYEENDVYPIYDTTSDEGMTLFSMPSVSVAAGATCSYVVKSDGSVWRWGTPGNAAANDESANKRENVPTKMQFLDDVKEICSSETHTIVLKNDGTVWGWGNNSCHQLGDFDYNITYPIQIFAGDTAVDISVNENSTIIAYEDYVLCAGWGYIYNDQEHGFAMIDDYGPYTIPLENVKKVSSGGMGNSNLGGEGILTENGDLYEQTSRKGANGQPEYYRLVGTRNVLGDGFHIDNLYAVDDTGFYEDYTLVESVFNTEEIADISSSMGTKTLVLYNDGSVYSLDTEIAHFEITGAGTRGYVVDSSADYSFEQIDELQNILSISCGESHYIALDASGNIYCWGDNTYGQCGVSDETEVLIPQNIFSINESNYFSIDSVEVNAEENMIEVYTTVNINYPTQEAAIKLCRTLNGEIVYVGQKFAEDGVYRIQMPLNSSGYYTLYMKMDGCEEILFDTFYYKNSEGIEIQAEDRKIIISLVDDTESEQIHSLIGVNLDTDNTVFVKNSIFSENGTITVTMPKSAESGMYEIRIGNKYIKRFQYTRPTGVQVSNTINITDGNIYDISVTGNNVSDINGKTFIVTYDQSKLELLDSVAGSYDCETSTMRVNEPGIKILSVTDGCIRFSTNNADITSEQLFIGVINVLKFKALETCETEISLVIEE